MPNVLPRASSIPTKSVKALAIDRRRIMRAAKQLEPDFDKRVNWFLFDPIYEFGGLTGEELLKRSEAELLLDMLRAIASGERDAMAIDPMS